MTKDLSTALSLLQSSGLRPDKEIYKDAEKEEFTAILLYWSGFTKQAGLTRINEIIGDDYLIKYQGNSSVFRITLK